MAQALTQLIQARVLLQGGIVSDWRKIDPEGQETLHLLSLSPVSDIDAARSTFVSQLAGDGFPPPAEGDWAQIQALAAATWSEVVIDAYRAMLAAVTP